MMIFITHVEDFILGNNCLIWMGWGGVADIYSFFSFYKGPLSPAAPIVRACLVVGTAHNKSNYSPGLRPCHGPGPSLGPFVWPWPPFAPNGLSPKPWARLYMENAMESALFGINRRIIADFYMVS